MEINQKSAEGRLRAVAKKRDRAASEVRDAVVETADLVPRRRAADLIGRTSGRVQQIIDAARRTA
jgi:hypothetical protein